MYYTRKLERALQSDAYNFKEKYIKCLAATNVYYSVSGNSGAEYTKPFIPSTGNELG